MKKLKTYFLSCFILYSINLLATSIAVYEPEYIVRNAALIVEAYVRDIEYHPIKNSSIGYADIRLTILDVIKGKCASEITIRRVGLEDDSRFNGTDYDPPYKIGEKFIICLSDNQKDFYQLLGLYRGKYVINSSGNINGTKYPKNEFRNLIISILNDKTAKFPLDIPRPIRVESDEIGHNKNNRVMSDGSHMGGAFYTYLQSWDPTITSINFYYNHANAPQNVSEATVIARIETAFSIWNSISHSRLILTYAGTTPDSQINNSINVIFWIPKANFQAKEYPNSTNGTGYNPGYKTKLGSDIGFSSSLKAKSTDDFPVWRFESSDPITRDVNNVDFIETLLHELGHTFGLAHIYFPSTSNIMYDTYASRTGPMRTLSNGDKAGAVYQHPKLYWSGSIPYNMLWSADIETFNITGNLTIPSGISLQIEPGKTLKFSPNTNLTIYGTLNASGSSGNRIIFTSDNPSNKWSGIVLSGSGAGNSIISNCNFENVQTYGGAVISLSNVSGSPKIEYTRIQNNLNYSTSAIYLNNTNGYIMRNRIEGNTNGIYCYNYSSPWLGYYSDNSCSNGNNYISGNTYGVRAFSNSSPYMGSGTVTAVAYNNISSNTTANLTATDYCYITASYDYWGSGGPGSSIIIGNNSSVDYSSWLTCAPVRMLKTSKEESGNIPYITANNNIYSEDLLKKAKEYQFEKRYTEAKEIFKQIIGTSSNNDKIYAISGLLSIYRENKDEDILKYFISVQKMEMI